MLYASNKHLIAEKTLWMFTHSKDVFSLLIKTKSCNKIPIIFISYLLVSDFVPIVYTLRIVDLVLIICMSCFQIDLKENTPIHGILPKTMGQGNTTARQDVKSTATQWQDTKRVQMQCPRDLLNVSSLM